MTKAILVTGGAGYIGSHACKALAQAGYLAIAYDNLIHGHREAVRWGPLVVAELADADQLRNAIERFDVTAVMHFAALALIAESVAHPLHYFRNNVTNSLTLIEAMQAHDIRHIVFSSTCAVYGIPPQIPISEGMEEHPINPYGESKLMVERILHWCSSAYGFTFAALRYFNAAGADPNGEIGEQHSPETHLIPLVLDAALGRLPHVDVLGTDYPTADGTAVRDYIHVKDLADAHVRALEYLLQGGPNVALNLGTGKGYSVREVITDAERILGHAIPVRETARRPGDPPVLVADASRSHELFGFVPKYSDLETILRTALKFRLNGFAPLGTSQS